MKIILFLSILLFNSSLLTNSSFAGAINSDKPSLNILILGNSVTFCPPNPSIGWKGNWGMAASSLDNDYVNVLTRKLTKSQKFKNVSVTTKNIAAWEKDFSYDLSKFDNIFLKNYDMIIVRLGDNVNERSENFENYRTELKRLINSLKSENTKMIITGTIWQSSKIEEIHRELALDNNYIYVSFSDFQKEPKNFSFGKFSDPGISAHPSDKGMRNIAIMLFKAIIASYKP